MNRERNTTNSLYVSFNFERGENKIERKIKSEKEKKY